jgi:hypothetical protein
VREGGDFFTVDVLEGWPEEPPVSRLEQLLLALVADTRSVLYAPERKCTRAVDARRGVWRLAEGREATPVELPTAEMARLKLLAHRSAASLSVHTALRGAAVGAAALALLLLLHRLAKACAADRSKGRHQALATRMDEEDEDAAMCNGSWGGDGSGGGGGGGGNGCRLPPEFITLGGDGMEPGCRCADAFAPPASSLADLQTQHRAAALAARAGGCEPPPPPRDTAPSRDLGAISAAPKLRSGMVALPPPPAGLPPAPGGAFGGGPAEARIPAPFDDERLKALFAEIDKDTGVAVKSVGHSVVVKSVQPAPAAAGLPPRAALARPLSPRP